MRWNIMKTNEQVLIGFAIYVKCWQELWLRVEIHTGLIKNQLKSYKKAAQDSLTETRIVRKS